MSINWYPGHMAKTRRLMLGDLKIVDAVCEILDARIPMASRNPDLDNIAQNKPRIIALNRADLADPDTTSRWERFFKEKGYSVIATNSQKGGFLSAFSAAVNESCKDILQRNSDKGLSGKRLKIMIFGVPNVGKSSFINRLLNRKSAIAADKPGVTRKNQWYSLPGGFDFMDTPGMLWPRIDDDSVGYKLAFTGTIRDEILDLEDLACNLIFSLNKVSTAILAERYTIDNSNSCSSIADAYDVLERMALSRGFLLSGGVANTERMSRVLLDEFREGKLGRISLEKPEDFRV